MFSSLGRASGARGRLPSREASEPYVGCEAAKKYSERSGEVQWALRKPMDETQRVRRILDEFAPKYDRSIRALGVGSSKRGGNGLVHGRLVTCSRSVLGTGRNLPF